MNLYPEADVTTRFSGGHDLARHFEKINQRQIV